MRRQRSPTCRSYGYCVAVGAASLARSCFFPDQKKVVLSHVTPRFLCRCCPSFGVLPPRPSYGKAIAGARGIAPARGRRRWPETRGMFALSIRGSDPLTARSCLAAYSRAIARRLLGRPRSSSSRVGCLWGGGLRYQWQRQPTALWEQRCPTCAAGGPPATVLCQLRP